MTNLNRSTITEQLEELGWTCKECHNHREFTREVDGADYLIKTNIERYADEFAWIQASWNGLQTAVDFLNLDVWSALTAIRDASFVHRARAK